jgi:phenylacetate-CoA ligase
MNITYLKQYSKYVIKKLIQKDYLNDKNIRKYQVEKINDVIDNAKLNSSFYKEFYKNVDFKIHNLDDIKKLPILKKDIFKNTIKKNTILSNNYNREDLLCGHTTGSTGTPLEMCFDKECSRLRSKVQGRLWNDMGILPHKRFVKIWRDKNLNKTEQELKDAGLLLSIAVGDVNDPLNSAVTNKKILSIINELQNFNPQVIRGYVSSLYSIAQLVEKLNVKFNTLESIVTSAEYLPEGIWKYFEEVFNCPVYNLYGGTEAPSIALNKKNTHNLILSEDLYYIEVLDENGNDVKAGQQGLITITDLHSKATPLIRYQIGDMAIVDETFYKINDSFRYFVSVEGRTNDIFELEDGSLIYSHLWFVYFRTENWIEKFKVVQETKKNINIKLLVIENYNYNSLIELQNKINSIYPNLNFLWEIVDKFDLENGNKFRSVLSKIENKFNRRNKG